MLALIKETTGAVVRRLAESEGWVRDEQGRALASPPVAGWQGAGYRLVSVEPAALPEGSRVVARHDEYDPATDTVVERVELADAPQAPVLTPAEKVDAMLADYGLTLADLKAVLAGGR